MAVGRVNRFEVYNTNLDLVVGSEIGKTRPAVVISPDEINHHLGTVIVAPLTKANKHYPSRVPSVFKGVLGQVVLDQIRTVDKDRLESKLGTIDADTQEKILDTVAEMFAA